MTSQTETPDIVTLLQTAINDRGKGSVWGYAGLLEDAAAEIERLRSELAKHQWRTMESAPRDGTPLLIAGRGWVAEGYYESDGDRGWYSANTDWTDAYDGSLYPTHWQPLPSPPGENE